MRRSTRCARGWRSRGERRSNPCLRSFTYASPTLAHQGPAPRAHRKTKAAQGHSRPRQFIQAAIQLHSPAPRPFLKRKTPRPPRHAPRCVPGRTTHAVR
ncbi:hypothetical protein BZL54_18220 [Burkholderia ubonensis subsp. mesacidophila]|uniref:Uncharacterized protein n=1 Tax=Burkholderia ubonensis subsp. mesacidophila TaxID=265293 RepID=A0A2A4FCQ1_9BURK|nr:hypothetical protein BZL54_18220 [Burkholderia ubonensis subsp. mesacidophila]